MEVSQQLSMHVYALWPNQFLDPSLIEEEGYLHKLVCRLFCFVTVHVCIFVCEGD